MMSDWNALVLLPCQADQEEHAHLPGQAAAQDRAGDAQNQHVHRRQLVTGATLNAFTLSLALLG
jgi:hypothetical protein